MNDVAAAWKGLATTSSFVGVDDEAAMNGKATQTDLRLEKKQQQLVSRGYKLGCT
jgi:hypothetical protein